MPVVLAGEDIADDSLYRNEVMRPFTISGKDNVLIDDAYGRPEFLRLYCGFDAKYMAADELSEKSQSEIAKMPVYPNEGSIQIIEGVMVIKLMD